VREARARLVGGDRAGGAGVDRAQAVAHRAGPAGDEADAIAGEPAVVVEVVEPELADLRVLLVEEAKQTARIVEVKDVAVGGDQLGGAQRRPS